MSDQTAPDHQSQSATAVPDAGSLHTDARRRSRTEFLLSLPQPVLVFSSMFAVATAITTKWIDPDLFTTFMIILPLPLILYAERIWTKNQSWIPTPKELAEDALWLACSGLIWAPLYDDYYRTPISDAFDWIRDLSALPFSLQPETAVGLVVAAVFARTCSEFIYYWLHRWQHQYLFWWRMHATHHHITKMSAARSDRTHPFEFAALSLGTPIVLALLGASDDLVAVTATFGFWNGWLNHANLPLHTNKVYGLLFSTSSMHHIHHSNDMELSNKNYGCTIILWDRLFGTYYDAFDGPPIGSGTGKPLSIPTQYALAFYPDEKLKSL